MKKNLVVLGAVMVLTAVSLDVKTAVIVFLTAVGKHLIFRR